MWQRGFGEGARRPRAERGGGGTKQRTQGGKCLGSESSWPHCTRSSTNLEYRPTGERSRRLATPRYSNHVAIQGSITKLSGTTRRRRRRRRAFSPFRLETDHHDGPSNGSPFAFRTGTRKRSVFVILVILVVARFPYLETKRIFVDERIPLKSNPVTTGERDTISWRMAVSTFPRIAVREKELDRRTHRCRSDLRRDFRSGSIPPFPIRANSNVSTR